MPPAKSAQIANDLRHDITRGDLRPGDKLPSEADLVDRYGTSRPTVRAAIATLTNEGLVISQHGSGTYVRQQVVLTYHAARAERHDGRGETDAYVSEVEAEGRRPTQDFSMRIEPASGDVAGRLHLDEGDLVCVRSCYRYVDGQPWSDQVSYYPMDVSEAAGLTVPNDIAEGTIRAMARAGHVEIGYVDDLAGRMPSPKEARSLDMAPGVPLIVYTRVAWTDRRPVRATQTLFPADRNRIVYELGDLSGVAGGDA